MSTIPVSNGQPPGSVTRSAPGSAGGGRWGDWAFKVLPVLVSIVLAVISFAGRITSLETGLKEVERRTDRIESKLDRMLENQFHRGSP